MWAFVWDAIDLDRGSHGLLIRSFSWRDARPRAADQHGNGAYSETRSISGGAATEEVVTTNTGGLTITTGYTDPVDSPTGKYSWLVVDTPAVGDTADLGSQSSCDAEHFNTTYTNDPGP
jgi:hypothetical protein